MRLNENGIQLHEQGLLLYKLPAYHVYGRATLGNNLTELVIPLKTGIQVVDNGACGREVPQWSTVEERALYFKELLQGQF